MSRLTDDMIADCFKAEINGDETLFEELRDILYSELVDMIVATNSIKIIYEPEIVKIRKTETSLDEAVQEKFNAGVCLMNDSLDNGNRPEAALHYKNTGIYMKYLMRPESLVVLYLDGTFLKVPMTKEELEVVKG